VLQCVTVCCNIAVCCSVLQCAAVCCSVLQCAAVCCSVLQCGAVCCRVFQSVAVYCSVMQCVAVYCSACNVLQCVAVCCSMLQCVAVCCKACSVLQCVAVSCSVCSVLQCVVVCCSVLQGIAVCCSVLQCVEVCCRVLQCAAIVVVRAVCGSVWQCVAACAACCSLWHSAHAALRVCIDVHLCGKRTFAPNVRSNISQSAPPHHTRVQLQHKQSLSRCSTSRQSIRFLSPCTHTQLWTYTHARIYNHAQTSSYRGSSISSTHFFFLFCFETIVCLSSASACAGINICVICFLFVLVNIKYTIHAICGIRIMIHIVVGIYGYTYACIQVIVHVVMYRCLYTDNCTCCDVQKQLKLMSFSFFGSSLVYTSRSTCMQVQTSLCVSVYESMCHITMQRSDKYCLLDLLTKIFSCSVPFETLRTSLPTPFWFSSPLLSVFLTKSGHCGACEWTPPVGRVDCVKPSAYDLYCKTQIRSTNLIQTLAHKVY